MLAWRDLDDDDAGGSEVHADEFERRWAAAGLEILHRTSAAAGQPPTDRRNGYDVVRRGSRYSRLPPGHARRADRPDGPSDALIEIWNGVPWGSPLWYRRRPRLTILHHVHGPMWDQIMPPLFAGAGRALESRLAPPWYRRTEVVTPSKATRQELIGLGLRPARVTAVDNGVDGFFAPAPDRDAAPTRAARRRRRPPGAGQAVPLPARGGAGARRRVPDLRLRIIGEGPQRPAPALGRGHDAAGWVELPGWSRPSPQLRDEYRRAWVVASERRWPRAGA